MARRIGSSLAGEDIAVQAHLNEEQEEALVRLEMRRAMVALDQATVVGLDLLPAEARILGQALLNRADDAESCNQAMARRRTCMRLPRSFLQNGKVMRPVHILGAAIGLKLFFLPPDERFF